MEDVMKNIIKNQIRRFSRDTRSGRSWFHHIANCIGVEICPVCGNEIFKEKTIKSVKLPRLKCSNCDWTSDDYNKDLLRTSIAKKQ